MKECLFSEYPFNKKPAILPKKVSLQVILKNSALIDAFIEYVKMYFLNHLSMTAPGKNSHQANTHAQSQQQIHLGILCEKLKR